MIIIINLQRLFMLPLSAQIQMASFALIEKYSNFHRSQRRIIIEVIFRNEQSFKLKPTECLFGRIHASNSEQFDDSMQAILLDEERMTRERAEAQKEIRKKIELKN